MGIQELAAHALEYFEQKTRGEGEEATRFWTMTNQHPIWVKEMIHKAHEDMMPDDYKYEYVVDTLDALNEDRDPEEGAYEIEADVYNYDLITWLRSNLQRVGFVDEAVEQMGHSRDMGVMGDLMMGQVEEKRQVWQSVVESLRERLEEIEEGVREKFESRGKVDRPGARGWQL